MGIQLFLYCATNKFAMEYLLHYLNDKKTEKPQQSVLIKGTVTIVTKLVVVMAPPTL